MQPLNVTVNSMFYRGGSVVIVSSVAAYSPFSVSAYLKYSFNFFFPLPGSWSLFCEQNCLNWIDQSIGSRACSRQYSCQLHCTRHD